METLFVHFPLSRVIILKRRVLCKYSLHFPLSTGHFKPSVDSMNTRVLLRDKDIQIFVKFATQFNSDQSVLPQQHLSSPVPPGITASPYFLVWSLAWRDNGSRFGIKKPVIVRPSQGV